MRDIKTLLQIVIDSIKLGHKEGWYNTGMCGEVNNLKDYKVISKEEEHLLIYTINDNRPDNTHRYDYWFPYMKYAPETRQIRIDYLTKLKDSL